VVFYIRLFFEEKNSRFQRPIASPDKARKPPIPREALLEESPTPIPKTTNRNDSPSGIINATLGNSIVLEIFRSDRITPTIPMQIISQIGRFMPSVMWPFIPVTDNVIPPKFGKPPGNAPEVMVALLIAIHSAGNEKSIRSVAITRATIRLFSALFILLENVEHDQPASKIKLSWTS